ncbi:MAG: hypothetical protein ACFFB5_11105 [Promethearchaeota archaeon]
MGNTSDLGSIISLWIIEKESGLPILSLKFTKDAQVDSGLFGAFMVAMRSMMDDIQIGELNSFQTNMASILLTGSEHLISIIALEKESNVDSWYPILLKIQKMSEKSYLDYRKISSILETNVFEQLASQFKEMILAHTERIKESEAKTTPITNGKRIREALKRL